MGAGALQGRGPWDEADELGEEGLVGTDQHDEADGDDQPPGDAVEGRQVAVEAAEQGDNESCKTASRATIKISHRGTEARREEEMNAARREQTICWDPLCAPVPLCETLGSCWIDCDFITVVFEPGEEFVAALGDRRVGIVGCIG